MNLSNATIVATHKIVIDANAVCNGCYFLFFHSLTHISLYDGLQDESLEVEIGHRFHPFYLLEEKWCSEEDALVLREAFFQARLGFVCLKRFFG